MAGTADDVVVAQDLQQRSSAPIGMLVGLVEQARHHACAEANVAVVGHRGVAAEHPQEVALAGAVPAQDGDPLAVPQLEIEGIGEAVQFELSHGQGPLAGSAPPSRMSMRCSRTSRALRCVRGTAADDSPRP